MSRFTRMQDEFIKPGINITVLGWLLLLGLPALLLFLIYEKQSHLLPVG